MWGSRLRQMLSISSSTLRTQAISTVTLRTPTISSTSNLHLRKINSSCRLCMENDSRDSENETVGEGVHEDPDDQGIDAAEDLSLAADAIEEQVKGPPKNLKEAINNEEVSKEADDHVLDAIERMSLGEDISEKYIQVDDASSEQQSEAPEIVQDFRLTVEKTLKEPASEEVINKASELTIDPPVIENEEYTRSANATTAKATGKKKQEREETLKRVRDKKTKKNKRELLKTLLTEGPRTSLFQKPITEEDANISSSLPEQQHSTYKSIMEREIFGEDQMLPIHPRNEWEVKMLRVASGQEWKFPIDNQQDHPEDAVSTFEDHVFLDHHLEDFPDVPAVREHMELVITGLQHNPYLGIERKLKTLEWYKDYFSKFSDKEMSNLH